MYPIKVAGKPGGARLLLLLPQITFVNRFALVAVNPQAVFSALTGHSIDL